MYNVPSGMPKNTEQKILAVVENIYNFLRGKPTKDLSNYFQFYRNKKTIFRNYLKLNFFI